MRACDGRRKTRFIINGAQRGARPGVVGVPVFVVLVKGTTRSG